MAENKKGIFAEIVKPTFILFAICIVISGALAVTDFITKDKIAEQEGKNLQETMTKLVPDADDYIELDIAEKDEAVGFKAIKNGQTISNVFVTSAKGYKSNVYVMTVIDAQKGSVTGVAVTSCDDETPGLGQKAKDESGDGKKLRDSFVGKSEVKVEKDADCMTGATITSKAVKSAVKKALELYKQAGGAN